MLSPHDYSMEFQKTHEHGNADALTCLLTRSDQQFNVEQMDEDVDNVSTVHLISRQIVQDGPMLLLKEISKG